MSGGFSDAYGLGEKLNGYGPEVMTGFLIDTSASLEMTLDQITADFSVWRARRGRENP